MPEGKTWSLENQQCEIIVEVVTNTQANTCKQVEKVSPLVRVDLYIRLKVESLHKQSIHSSNLRQP